MQTKVRKLATMAMLVAISIVLVYLIHFPIFPGAAFLEYDPADIPILIGAFANQGNVKVLQSKLGELGLKVYTEPLDTPEGKKTRVRVGPFPNRDGADKALDKMKRIGVNGVVAAKP